jgi:hypothetical protein
VTASSGTCNAIEMITHKTTPATMMAVRISRARVGANWDLNHSKEPNGSIAAWTALELVEFI